MQILRSTHASPSTSVLDNSSVNVLHRPSWPPAGHVVGDPKPSTPRFIPRTPIPSVFTSKPRLSYVGVQHASEGMCVQKTTWAEKFEAQPLPPPSITKSDSEFESLGVEFVEGTDDVSIPDLNNLFEKVGFPRRDPDKLRTALTNSYHCVWIRCAKKTRMAKMGQMIGFARATSDGALSATIWDVAVNPGWQRAGLGRALMERLTCKLVVDGIPTIALYAEPAVVALYERLGYVKDPDGIKGMAFKQRRKKTLPTR